MINNNKSIAFQFVNFFYFFMKIVDDIERKQRICVTSHNEIKLIGVDANANSKICIFLLFRPSTKSIRNFYGKNSRQTRVLHFLKIQSNTLPMAHEKQCLFPFKL